MTTLTEAEVDSAAFNWRSGLGCHVFHEREMASLGAHAISLKSLHPRLVKGVTR